MDEVDEILAQWGRVRPDLDVAPMGTLGRLARVSVAVRNRMEKTWKQHGLNGASFDVLATLRRSPQREGLSPSQLLEATMVTSGTMTNRIDRLVEAGLVERVTHPDDKRSFLIRLTPAGFERIDRAINDHVEAQRQLVSKLSANERRALDTLLSNFMEALEGPAKR